MGEQNNPDSALVVSLSLPLTGNRFSWIHLPAECGCGVPDCATTTAADQNQRFGTEEKQKECKFRSADLTAG